MLPLCLLVLSGCTTAFYKRSADKEAYRLIGEKQGLVQNMEPRFSIEQTNGLNLETLPLSTSTNSFLGQAAAAEAGARVLSLEHALAIGIHQSRLYQNNKEQLFLAALDLSLSRHQFQPIFSIAGSASYDVQTAQTVALEPDPVTGEPKPVLSDNLAETHSFDVRGRGGVDWLIRDVGRISVAFTTDFLRFLVNGPGTLASSSLGATFTRPLLRNANYQAQIENLTQSERNLLYELRTFVLFRKSFSVNLASAYYGVLGNRDAARNAFLNLEGSRRTGERTRALAAEGRTPQGDLGRIEEQELTAEGLWISTVRNYQRSLDDFKLLLGLPIETRIILDDQELQQLKIRQPGTSVEDAIRIALAARPDYQNALDQYADSKRKVALAANRLKPQLDFVAGASISSGERHDGFALPDPERYRWNAGFDTIDLGLDRKAERNDYRSALINEARAARTVEQRRDEITLQVRESWRTLQEARRSYEISEVGVKLNQRRVEEQELLAELGRAKALDQVDTQNALLASMDRRTTALVAHTIARLQFWQNMGILYIKDNGQWVDQEPSIPQAGGN